MCPDHKRDDLISGGTLYAPLSSWDHRCVPIREVFLFQRCPHRGCLFSIIFPLTLAAYPEVAFSMSLQVSSSEVCQSTASSNKTHIHNFVQTAILTYQTILEHIGHALLEHFVKTGGCHREVE